MQSNPEPVDDELDPAPHRLYKDLASWFPLLTAPEEYIEEADIITRTIESFCPSAHTLLELGSGGGNTASHLKQHFQPTLIDFSPNMLEVSRRLNPECEHIEGDMRTVRLGRRFDAVLIHDAISYMTTEDDLRLAMETAWIHCRPGGVALFLPDFVRETFTPGAESGGHDGPTRGLRYLEWCWDPNPDDTCYTIDFAYLLRESDGSVLCEQDRHICGVFPRATWLRLLTQVGFVTRAVPFDHSQLEPGSHEIFLGTRP